MHMFFAREAWRSFLHHRGLAYTAIMSLTAALLLSGVFLLLAHNAELALRYIGDRREMVVYLRDEVTPLQRDSLVTRLQPLYGAVTVVSKDQAWQEFVQQVGDPSLVEAVDQNPLPASLRVRLKPELLNYDAMQLTARQLRAFPEVEDVRFGGEWVRRLDELTRTFTRGALAAGIVVALAIVFVVHNTLRLTVIARRSQVEIMSRLGASDRFIATPFVIEATVQALIAALLALGLLWALHQAVLLRAVHMAFLSPSWSAAFVGAAVLLAWISSLIGVGRVLRTVGS